jgi:hypothetical protein
MVSFVKFEDSTRNVCINYNVFMLVLECLTLTIDKWVKVKEKMTLRHSASALLLTDFPKGN